jgi:stage III sporulation protein AB
MNYKWIGAVLVVIGCGSVGFTAAANHKREEKILIQLLDVLKFMQCELQYRLTPLPELCRQAGQYAKDVLRCVFLTFVKELEAQIAPDPLSCMRAAVACSREVPENVQAVLLQLGQTLGHFDLPGQLQGLQSAQEACRMRLKEMEKSRDERLRGYQTLGLCAGAALVILFI